MDGGTMDTATCIVSDVPGVEVGDMVYEAQDITLDIPGVGCAIGKPSEPYWTMFCALVERESERSESDV